MLSSKSPLRSVSLTALFSFFTLVAVTFIQSPLLTGNVAFAAELDIKQAIEPSQFEAAGDRLIYRYSVTNDGGNDLSDVVVKDSLNDEVCVIGLLSPTYTALCTAYYFVSDADVRAGVIRNTATVTADNSSDTAEVSGTISKAAPNDAVTVSVATVRYEESAGTTNIELKLSKAAPRGARVLVSTIENTASEGVDYYGLFQVVDFEQGAVKASVPITILEDTRVEGDETFTVRLFSPRGLKIAKDFNTVTIKDNDVDGPELPKLSIDWIADNPLGEGDGQAKLFVSLSDQTTETVSVNVTTQSGTALAGEDFVELKRQLTIEPGQSGVSLSVDIIDDEIVEQSESFQVTLSDATNAVLVKSSARVNIVDDDEPQAVSISIADVTVDEGDGTIQVPVTLSARPGAEVKALVKSNDGSAVAGEDYKAVVTPIVFSQGQQRLLVPISIIDDTLQERKENFTVSLSEVDGATVADDKAVVTISDNEAVQPKVQLRVGDARVNEQDGTVEVPVVLDRTTTDIVNVKVATKDDTAVAGSDFRAVATTLTFEAGDERKVVAVRLIDDQVSEPIETFQLELSDAVNSTILDGTGIVTIVDNDVPVVVPAVSIASAIVSESDGTIQVAVTLSEATTVPVGIRVDSKDGTAVAGDDYEAVVANDLVFEPGSVRQVVTVTIVDDAREESRESFELKLSDPKRVTVDDGTGVITINDDDESSNGTITARGVTVVESAGTAKVTLTLAPALTTEATVRFATQAGTATPGEDFQGDSGTVTFAAGTTSKTVSIAIIDDDLVEDTESFDVAFTNATGAVIGTDSVTIKINDNDRNNSDIGPQPVAACNATSATGVNQIEIAPGDNVVAKINAAPAGAEFLIKAGEYRMEDTITPKNNQRLICEDGAVFNGSVLLSGAWEREAASGLYYIDGAPEAKTSGGFMQPGRQINATLNDLIIDDEVYLRVESKDLVNNTSRIAKDGQLIYPGTFFQDGTRLYVASDPTGKRAEMSDVSWAFYAATNLGDNVVMENCTVEKYTGLDISAAIELKQTSGWLLRNVTSRLNHTGGMHAGSETTVLCGDYSLNGQTGISTSFAEGGGDIFSFADNLVVNGARVAYNNWAEYNVQWHAGGMKFFLTDKVTITNSRVHDNLGVGIWSDFDVFDSVIENNHLYNNLSRAVQIEASFKASVQRNLVECNTLDPAYSLGWSWFWGSSLFAKNTPEVEIAFNKVDVLNGQGIGVVDNFFRAEGKYGFQQALRNSVHDNVVSYGDIPKPGGNDAYQYFFQRSGVESDGPQTTGGDGAMNCTPDSTLFDKLTQAEIDAAVAACNARGGFDATAANASNQFFNNTYNYAEDYTHFRIRGGSFKSDEIPAPFETGSVFNIGATPRLTNLCQ